MVYPEYPITLIKSAFLDGYKTGSLLVEAEPGAGKSTLVPLWVLDNTPSNRKVVLVQPRVLAAQAIAARLASIRGEALGDSVGYKVAYDQCTSPKTRLEVVTPGILLQQLLHNPFAEDIETIILDEVHERSEAQDMLWAFLQEVRILQPDINVIAMSATPDPQWKRSVDKHLFAAGRCFPVTTQFAPIDYRLGDVNGLAEQVVSVLKSHKGWMTETLLIFLPGWREIEAVARFVGGQFPQQKLFRLHSQIDAREQRLALDENQGPRVILSTNVAETSITIPDVTLVIDTGLAKRVDYEQKTGVSRLRLGRISQASADQRRGRAGRVRAGHCIRLWSQNDSLAPTDLPEIRVTDYLPLALRLAHWQEWGSAAKDLPWLEAPNPIALESAIQLLTNMGFVRDGCITDNGKKVAQLGTHPRIAALLLSSEALDETLLLIALALHFEWSHEGTIDDYLKTAQQELQRNKRWQILHKRWEKQLRLTAQESSLGLSLARAFPDRIGASQPSGKYRLNSGMSVSAWSSLATEWAVFPLVIAAGKGNTGLGFPLELTASQLKTFSQQTSRLIQKNNDWLLLREWHIGGELVDSSTEIVNDDRVAQHLIHLASEKINERGLFACIGDDSARRLLERAQLAQSQTVTPYPSVTPDFLAQNLKAWLQPFVQRQHNLDNFPWLPAVEFYLGYEGQRWLDDYLPAFIELPSARKIQPHINAEGEACVSAKLQEFFGCESLVWGKSVVPLRIELLSPNGSPLAITRDLKNFWHNAYKDVCKEMRGRYPRHPWPDDPWAHQATALTKRKLQQQSQ